MRDLSGMGELQRIAYRCGFNDGLAAMRERLKDLLLENARLRRPILGPAHLPAAARDRADPPISGEGVASWLAPPGAPAPFVPMVGGGYERDAVATGNGSGRR